MFKLQRTKRIKDELALCDADGNTMKIIEVDFDADVMGQRFHQAWNNIIKAEQMIKGFETSSDPAEMSGAFDAYGNAVLEMIRLVFGDENAVIIADHYENRPTEMATEVYPFIMQVVLPQVKAAADEKTERLRSNYKASKR